MNSQVPALLNLRLRYRPDRGHRPAGGAGPHLEPLGLAGAARLPRHRWLAAAAPAGGVASFSPLRVLAWGISAPASTPVFSREYAFLPHPSPLPEGEELFRRGPGSKGEEASALSTLSPRERVWVRGTRCTQTLSLPEKTWGGRRACPWVEFPSREALLSARYGFLAAGNRSAAWAVSPLAEVCEKTEHPQPVKVFRGGGVCLTALWLCSENSPWTSSLGW
jgi:hypothetical protein